MRGSARFLACLLVGLCVSQSASAQLAEDLIPPEHDFVSPERFMLELRAGPYTPNLDAFEKLYNDVGPLLELELSVIALRLDDLLYLGAGGAIGFSAYSAGALTANGDRTEEEAELDLLPLSLMAIARIDALPRQLSIPLIFTGKLGYTWMHYATAKGGVDEDSGWSHGLRWGGQVALDLDTFEPRAARALDEEWGINHSFLFFEMWGFTSVGKALALDDTNWSAGLGFVF